MAVKSRAGRTSILAALCLTMLVGCAIKPIASPARIGLLAPFEGRYREIGYEALYAVRLAITESGRDDITLLAVDDGGTEESARFRARALTDDPLVKVVIVLGYDAASVTDLFADVPVIVVENWFTKPGDNTFILGSQQLAGIITTDAKMELTEAAHIEAPATGGIIFALQGFRVLRNDHTGLQFISSAALPDEEFQQRYNASDQFTPEPGLLATLSYDAANLALAVVTEHDISRSDVTVNLETHQFQGINGLIAFQNGYWREAPLYTYTYLDNGELTLTDHIIE